MPSPTSRASGSETPRSAVLVVGAVSPPGPFRGRPRLRPDSTGRSLRRGLVGPEVVGGGHGPPVRSAPWSTRTTTGVPCRRSTRPRRRCRTPMAGRTAVAAADPAGDASISAVLDAIEQELADVELALERLGDGRYGRCETCGGGPRRGRARSRPGRPVLPGPPARYDRERVTAAPASPAARRGPTPVRPSWSPRRSCRWRRSGPGGPRPP